MFNANPVHRVFMFILLLLAAIPADSARALITGSYGNAPVTDHNWRVGAVDVANLKSRVGYWEGPPFGGGETHFLYRGNSQAFGEALTLFAKIRAPALEIYVHDGPHEDFWLKPASNETDAKALARDARVDWTFITHDAQSWYHLYNNPTGFYDADSANYRKPLAAPRLEVYIGGGLIEWDKVQIPANVRVIDLRASALGLNVAEGSVVRGIVYDQATSKTIAGATISLSRMDAQGKPQILATARSNAEGVFQIEKLSAGGLRVRVSAEGYSPRDAAYDSLNGHDARVHDLDLAPAASISGTVLDGAGRPVAAAEVRVNEAMGMDGLGYRNDDRARVTTDAQGRFELAGLPRGYVSLGFSAKGFHPVWNPTPLATPAKDVVLRAGLTGRVSGRVLGPDGKPQVSNKAQVSIQDATGTKVGTWGGSMNLQADGSFTFEDVPVGRYEITTEALLPGLPRPANVQTISVEAGKTAEVDLKGQ